MNVHTRGGASALGRLVAGAALTLSAVTGLFAGGAPAALAAGPVVFPVGPGFTDVVPHQLVRAANDRLFVLAGRAQHSADLNAFWTTTHGIPATSDAFAGSAQIGLGESIVSVDAAYDGSSTIHALVNTVGGNVYDVPFDVSTGVFRSAHALAAGNPPVNDGNDYVGTSGVSGTVDLAGQLHVAYWSADNHITHRTFTYLAPADVVVPLGDTFQVDQDGAATHPSVAVSPLDGSLTVAWLSQPNGPSAGGQILARRRSAAGSWGAVEVVSSPFVAAWGSTLFGLSVDQGPSLVIDAGGTRHLSYIEHYALSPNPNAEHASNVLGDYVDPFDYGQVHYVTDSGTGWVDTTVPDTYSHDPALALTAAGQVYLIGHGHPLNVGAETNSANGSCLQHEEMCIKRLEGGTWTPSEVLIAPTGNDSFDASPSIKWSAVGWTRPEAVEFLFFRANGGSYSDTTIFYATLAEPTEGQIGGDPGVDPNPTATPELGSLSLFATGFGAAAAAYVRVRRRTEPRRSRTGS